MDSISAGGLSESTHLRTIESEYNMFLRAALHDAGLLEMALYWRELVDRQDIGPLLREDWINPMWGY